MGKCYWRWWHTSSTQTDYTLLTTKKSLLLGTKTLRLEYQYYHNVMRLNLFQHPCSSSFRFCSWYGTSSSNYSPCEVQPAEGIHSGHVRLRHHAGLDQGVWHIGYHIQVHSRKREEPSYVHGHQHDVWRTNTCSQKLSCRRLAGTRTTSNYFLIVRYITLVIQSRATTPRSRTLCASCVQRWYDMRKDCEQRRKTSLEPFHYARHLRFD
jgi:hypothetical protein